MKEKKIRNDLIRSLYKKGLGGSIGAGWGISRQRVHQIKNKKHIGFWSRLWKRIH